MNLNLLKYLKRRSEKLDENLDEYRMSASSAAALIGGIDANIFKKKDKEIESLETQKELLVECVKNHEKTEAGLRDEITDLSKDNTDLNQKLQVHRMALLSARGKEVVA